MKYTVNEFAQEIRKMYPGDYDDLSNSNLVELWLRKYPNDRSKIEFGTSQSSPVNPVSNSSSSSFSGWIFFIIIGIVLALTNPDESKHISEANTAFKHILNKNLDNSGNSLESGLGSMIGGALVDNLTEYVVSRRNYVFFSTTIVSILGKEKVIGIGILGNVFISEDVKLK